MSRDGFPIAHEVFPGNTAEVETFRHVLADVRARFDLGRVILVADRGMVSEKVLREIEEAGLEYIVGVRMRRLRAAKEVLSRAGRYHEVSPNLMVKEVVHQGRRYIVCLNPEQADHDAKVRKEAVARLREKLRSGRTKELIANSAFRRYLKLDGARVSIDERALAEEARYDGKYVLGFPFSGGLDVEEAWGLRKPERGEESLLLGRGLGPLCDASLGGDQVCDMHLL